MVDLFRYPNIRSLASYLDGANGADTELERAAQRAALRRSRAHRRGPAREGER
jgi:hypothetical protein